MNIIQYRCNTDELCLFEKVNLVLLTKYPVVVQWFDVLLGPCCCKVGGGGGKFGTCPCKRDTATEMSIQQTMCQQWLWRIFILFRTTKRKSFTKTNNNNIFTYVFVIGCMILLSSVTCCFSSSQELDLVFPLISLPYSLINPKKRATSPSLIIVIVASESMQGFVILQDTDPKEKN